VFLVGFGFEGFWFLRVYCVSFFLWAVLFFAF